LASASIGIKTGLFKPINGHLSHLKGKDITNPLASILSASLMLQHLGLHEEAFAIERAVEKSIQLCISTEDIKGKNKYVATTSKVGDFIADYIANQEDSNLNFQNIHMGQSTII
jgi:3-isopropylmalate dehydrogenase